MALGVISGVRYQLMVRAQNVYGWGPYSNVSSVLAASVPGQMSLISITENSDTTVTLSWALPIENGSPVSKYSIKILS
jgi:hypothetical protein